MKLLNNYIFRTAVVVVFLLASIPLVMPSRSPVRIDVEEDTNLTLGRRAQKTLNRIYDFYTQPPAAKEPRANAAQTNAAAPTTPGGDAPLSIEELRAIAANPPPARASAQRNADLLAHAQQNSGGSYSTSAGHNIPLVYSQPRKANDFEPRALEYNGKKYDVLQAHGKKFALTENGPIELEIMQLRGARYSGKTEALHASAISKEDFAARNAPPRPAGSPGAGAFGGLGGLDGVSGLSGSTMRASAPGYMSLSAAYGRAASGSQGGGDTAAATADIADNSAPPARRARSYGGLGGIIITPMPAQPGPGAPQGAEQGFVESSYTDIVMVSVPVPAEAAPVSAGQEPASSSLINFRMPPATIGVYADDVVVQEVVADAAARS